MLPMTKIQSNRGFIQPVFSRLHQYSDVVHIHQNQKYINMFTSFLEINFVLHMHCFRFYTFSMTAFVQFCFSYTYYLMCWKYLQGGCIQIIDSLKNNANHCSFDNNDITSTQQQHGIMSCNNFNYMYKRLKWNLETCDHLLAYMPYLDTL